MNRYDPIEYQSHSLLFLRPDARMGFIDYIDRTSIKSISALVPDKQYSEPITKRQKWYCSCDIRCYDARDFINSAEYAAEIWSKYQEVIIAFSTTLWAVDLASKFEPKLSEE